MTAYDSLFIILLRSGDGTHHKKQTSESSQGGDTHRKNILVVDEQGNEYEATWPKRAKGLVKSGRARFVEENKICLACPPNTELEGKKMSDNMNSKLSSER